MDKTSPLDSGDRMEYNDIQGDDREKPTSTKSGDKTSLMVLHKNSQTFKNRRWSSPWLAVYAARRPSFKRGNFNPPKLFKPKFAPIDFLNSLTKDGCE